MQKKTTAIFLTATLLALGMRAALGIEAVTQSGVPEGIAESDWLMAAAEIEAVQEDDGRYTLHIEARNLVPQGIYTIWAVETGVFGMRASPAGGLPANTFVADSDGFATRTIVVDAGAGYDRLVIAYHADHRTHGESPGEMGTETFEHLAGEWPVD